MTYTQIFLLIQYFCLRCGTYSPDGVAKHNCRNKRTIFCEWCGVTGTRSQWSCHEKHLAACGGQTKDHVPIRLCRFCPKRIVATDKKGCGKALNRHESNHRAKDDVKTQTTPLICCAQKNKFPQ